MDKEKDKIRDSCLYIGYYDYVANKLIESIGKENSNRKLEVLRVSYIVIILSTTKSRAELLAQSSAVSAEL